METLFASVITAVATLGATFLSLWLRHKYETKQKEKNILHEHSRRNQNVYTALDYVLNEFDTDRAYVFEFHNGEVYYSGGSQQKFSCTYEVVSEGISAEAMNVQSMRVSNFHYFIDELIKEGGFCCVDIEKIEDASFKNMLQDRGVESFYATPIKTLNGKIIGLLGIDFVKSSKTDCSPDLYNLKQQARIIGGYLA